MRSVTERAAQASLVVDRSSARRRQIVHAQHVAVYRSLCHSESMRQQSRIIITHASTSQELLHCFLTSACGAMP